jgi:polysaccharide deacetylase 2 family uncharacterized protein YibQ
MSAGRGGRLVAACLLLLCAAAGIASLLYSGGDSAPAAAAAAEAQAPPKIVSLPVPPRPQPPAPFRVLSPEELGEMTEMLEDGTRLPRIAASGWMPWIAFARRFEAPASSARIGILMVNLGADATLTRRAIEELPGEVSLAFLPGSPDLPRWLKEAHERGHEVYFMLPMDDQSVPAERGLKPVQPTLESAENVRRLRLAMRRGEGYVGFVLSPGGAAWQSEAVLRPLVQEIAQRGLGVVEVNPAAKATAIQRLTEELGAGYARTREVLDYKLSEGGIAANLDQLDAWVSERGASDRGASDRGASERGTNEGAPGQPSRHRFGVVQPDGDAIDTIAAWIRGRPKKPAANLVPVIGHFECRDACMARLRAQPAQLKP